MHHNAGLCASPIETTNFNRLQTFTNTYKQKIMSLKLEVGKSYKTRRGLKATILKSDLKGHYSIVGYVENEDSDYSTCWTKEGFHSHSNPDIKFDNDIISEWIEPLQFDWDCLPKWCNDFI